MLYTEFGICAMLRSHNLTPKVPDFTHKNKVTNKEIEEWQKFLKRWILCVKRDDFDLYIQDKTMLLRDHVPKRSPMIAQRPKSIADLF